MPAPAQKKPLKPKAPTAPKGPSAKSKTGNAACSAAASNWQLAIRGKASINPDTYKTLAKCRAMTRTSKNAEGRARAGYNLSDQGANAIKGRLQSRFDRNLITQKSRDARVKELLAGRAAKQAAPVAKPAAAPAPAKFSRNGELAPGRGTTVRSGKVADTMEARASKTLKREANRNAIPLSFKKQVPKGYTAEVFQGKDSTGKDSALTPKFVKRVTGSTGIQREKVGKKNEYRVVSLTDTHYGLNAGRGWDEKHATRMAKLLDYLGRRAQRTTGGSNPMDAMVKNLESGMQYRTLFAITKRGRRPGNTQ